MNRINVLIFSLFIAYLLSVCNAQESKTTHVSTIKTEGHYVDPTAKDLVYLNMPLKLKGDKVISYEDPLTKKFVDCNIPFHKMNQEEKSSMQLIDSRGRSFEYYIGGCEYMARIGKLNVYFGDPTFNEHIDEGTVYKMDKIDEKPYIEDGSSRNVKSIEQFVSSRLIRDSENNNPINELDVSLIVNRDGVISDILISGTSDNALKDEILKILKRMPKAVPAKLENRKVNVAYRFKLKVRSKMSDKQNLDVYKKQRDLYYSQHKDDIEYARLYFTNKTKNNSTAINSSRLKELDNFIDELPLTTIITSYESYNDVHVTADLESSEGTVKKWNKIIDNLFKTDKSHKSTGANKEVYFKGGYDMGYDKVLKNKEDNKPLTAILNKLNDKIYYTIINNAVYRKLNHKNFFIPQNLSDLDSYYSRQKSDDDFKDYFETRFKKKVDNLKKNPEFNNFYTQWEEEYYLAKIGKLRNVVLNKDKTKILAEYKFIENWTPYPTDKGNIDRQIYFNNDKPYMLYVLQKHGGGNYRWLNGIVVSVRH